jgi:hypothetical protein
MLLVKKYSYEERYLTGSDAVQIGNGLPTFWLYVSKHLLAYTAPRIRRQTSS